MTSTPNLITEADNIIVVSDYFIYQMSIASIRQRKLFKNPNRSLLLNRLLTDPNADSRIQIQCPVYHLKTEQSSASDHEHDSIPSCYRNSRDSLCSRPTLQSTQHHNNNSTNAVLIRQLSNLEDKVVKQQALTERCFEQMEKLDQQHQTHKDKLREKFEARHKMISDRINKQKQRNARLRQTNIDLIDKISTVFQQQGKQSSLSWMKANTLTRQFLQLVSFVISRKQIQNQRSSQINHQTNQKLSQKTIQHNLNQDTARKQLEYSSKADISLNLEIKISSQQRESESILLDDSI